MLPITFKIHTYFPGLQGPTGSGTRLPLHLYPHHSLPAHSSHTGILSLLKHAIPPAFCSHSPLPGGLFPQVVLTIRSLLKSHLYNETFPNYPAKVASQSLFLDYTSEPPFYMFDMCELCFPGA